MVGYQSPLLLATEVLPNELGSARSFAQIRSPLLYDIWSVLSGFHMSLLQQFSLDLLWLSQKLGILLISLVYSIE